MNPDQAWEILTETPDEVLVTGNRTCTYFGKDAGGNDLVECDVEDFSDEYLLLDSSEFLEEFRGNYFTRLNEAA